MFIEKRKCKMLKLIQSSYVMLAKAFVMHTQHSTKLIWMRVFGARINFVFWWPTMLFFHVVFLISVGVLPKHSFHCQVLEILLIILICILFVKCNVFDLTKWPSLCHFNLLCVKFCTNLKNNNDKRIFVSKSLILREFF
jgi:hypothetical protein